MPGPFAGKVVAITGAGKGLGRAYAHHFARLGASVVVNNRCHEGETESSADRVVDEIAGAGGRAVAEYGSVEDSEAGDRLLGIALETFGRLDSLVANAAVSESRSFRKQSLEGMRAVLDINLMGTINVVHPVFRHMCEEHGGSIVVSTSSAGLFGAFGLPAYSASKAAVIGLMQSLSLEGAPKNVRVNAIAPYASTQMTAKHLADEVRARLAPDLVAPVVARLAGGDSTGQVWIAGAGRVARARMRTSDWSPLPDLEKDACQMPDAAPLTREFDSAGANFEDLVACFGKGG